MIQLLNRSFYPDTEATGQFLSDLASDLAEKFPVTAICGRSYSVKDRVGVERHNRVEIIRVPHSRLSKESNWRRLVNWFTYLGMAFGASLTRRPKFLFVQTDPPLLGAMALILRRLHRCAVVLNCRDLYPDVAVELGVVKGWITRAFDALNRRVYRESAVTVALGEDMARRIADKGVPRDKIVVIPDWVDTAKIVPIENSEYSQGRFTLMYSGNIGLTQDFDVVLDALTGLPGATLMLVGGGAGRSRVEARVKALGNAILLPSQPREKLSALFSAGTLHVVPMKKGLAGCVVPSKIYGIMAAGRPYLAVCDREADMAKLALAEGCGLWAPAGDVAAVRERLQWAIDHPAELEEMGKRGRKLAVERFDAKLVLAQWKNLFTRLYG